MKKIGLEPENPHQTKNAQDAQSFAQKHVVCPKCGKQGNNTIEGHATLVNKEINGKLICLDAHCVKCSKCGNMFAVFHNAYDGWEQKMQIQRLFKDVSVGLHFLTGSGIDPNVWLPRQAMKDETPKQVATLRKFTGVLLIHSLDSTDTPPEENGCGHIQFAFIGPTMKAIVDFIKGNPLYLNAFRGKGKCATCEKPLKNIIIGFDVDLDESEKNALSEIAPVQEGIQISIAGVGKYHHFFDDAQWKKAETEVYTMYWGKD